MKSYSEIRQELKRKCQSVKYFTRAFLETYAAASIVISFLFISLFLSSWLFSVAARRDASPCHHSLQQVAVVNL